MVTTHDKDADEWVDRSVKKIFDAFSKERQQCPFKTEYLISVNDHYVQLTDVYPDIIISIMEKIYFINCFLKRPIKSENLFEIPTGSNQESQRAKKNIIKIYPECLMAPTIFI